MVSAVLSEASVAPADETDVGMNYGGTRSGEEPIRVSGSARSSPPRRLATVTDRDPEKMDWILVFVTPMGTNGGSTTRAKCYLGRPDNFVE